MGFIKCFPSICTELGLSPSVSNMVGIDGPYISASKSPTLKPIFDKVTAKLAVTVDLPTPPFPDAMTMMFFTPCISFPRILGFGLVSGEEIFSFNIYWSLNSLENASFMAVSSFFFSCIAGEWATISI